MHTEQQVAGSSKAEGALGSTSANSFLPPAGQDYPANLIYESSKGSGVKKSLSAQKVGEAAVGVGVFWVYFLQQYLSDDKFEVHSEMLFPLCLIISTAWIFTASLSTVE